MAASPLIECRHKLGRAEEHLKSLDVEIATFLDGKPYEIVREYESEQPKYLFRMKIKISLPTTRWALVIGDCVHNARCALDYIAWRLAGSDLSDRNVMWPIFETKIGFDTRGRARLSRVDPQAVAEIAALQPYNRPNPQTDFFWILQELDARDKHKLLTTSYAFNNTGTLTIHTPADATGHPAMGITYGRFSPDPRADHDAIIAEVPLPIAPDSVDPQVRVDGQFTFDIAFERSIVASTNAIYPVRDTLHAIIKAVDFVISRFEELLIKNPHRIPI
jgi:hypothetical protein